DRLVDDLDHAGMQALVLVDADMIVREERVAQRVDVVAVAGEEGPARQQRAVRFGVRGEGRGIVLVRLQRDVAEEEVLAHAAAEVRAMDLHHPRGRCRASRLAGRVHHHDHHGLALQDVVVEADLLVLVIAEDRVRNEVRQAAVAVARVHAGRGHGSVDTGKQLASLHYTNPPVSFLGRMPAIRLFSSYLGGRPASRRRSLISLRFSVSCWRLSTTSHRTIMKLSSWFMLWQWMR